MENRAMNFRIALRILEDEETLRDLKRSEIRAKSTRVLRISELGGLRLLRKCLTSCAG
jgi:hypothetical protein